MFKKSIQSVPFLMFLLVGILSLAAWKAATDMRVNTTVNTLKEHIKAPAHFQTWGRLAVIETDIRYMRGGIDRIEKTLERLDKRNSAR